MARGRKAVENGSMRRSARKCQQTSSAETAASTNVAKPSIPMDSTHTRAKKTPRRAAKDRYEEEKLMTSDKSQLIDLDLVRLLALPEAWSCLEENEKKEILSLLPSDTHPNPNPHPDDSDAKIPPLPESFLRYSNNWRDGIRNFQLDLQNGRYDPAWIREAEEAVQQRAAGKFDKFKEQEFEEFWGQKQKMDRALTAGESSRIKVSTLVEHGVIRKGDVWKWSRAFGGRKRNLLIEKEARIVEINGPQLTFVVPPGQRIFLKAANAKSSLAADKPEFEKQTPPALPTDDTISDVKSDSDAKSTEAGSCRKRSAEPEIQITATKRLRGRPRKRQPPPVEDKTRNITVEIINSPSEDKKDLHPSEDKPDIDMSTEPQNGISQTDEAKNDTQSEQLTDSRIADKKLSGSASEANGEPDEIVVPNIQGPTQLTLKILEIDGRVKNPTNGNAWKEIRSFRDNQDMGSLWEVRQAWFVKKK